VSGWLRATPGRLWAWDRPQHLPLGARRLGAPGWTGSDAKRANWPAAVGHGSIAHQVDGPGLRRSARLAPNTNWLSVVSDAGGHGMPCRSTNGYGRHRHSTRPACMATCRTETDGVGAPRAGDLHLGDLRRGTFHQPPPPGPAPTCGPDALASAADRPACSTWRSHGRSCADGWALGTGTAPGYANGFGGAF